MRPTTLLAIAATLGGGFGGKQRPGDQYLVYRKAAQGGLEYWIGSDWTPHRSNAMLMDAASANNLADRVGGKAVKR